MSTFVGTVGDTDYHVHTILPGWSWRAILVKVTHYDHVDDLVQIEDLGRVRDHDQAVDKALVIVERKRVLLASISRTMNTVRKTA
jgi:hypothetical protein